MEGQRAALCWNNSGRATTFRLRLHFLTKVAFKGRKEVVRAADSASIVGDGDQVTDVHAKQHIRMNGCSCMCYRGYARARLSLLTEAGEVISVLTGLYSPGLVKCCT